MTGGFPQATAELFFSNSAVASGTVVSILATGLGQKQPVGTDGVIQGDLAPRPVNTVTERIGGVAAEIQSATGVPGTPWGLFPRGTPKSRH